MEFELNKLTPEQRMKIGAELKKKPKDELEQFLLSLTPQQREQIMYDTYLFLRPKQYIPVNREKNITLALCGRGSVLLGSR